MILVDSSVWIDYFNGRRTPAADRLDGLLGREPVVAGDLILVEVLRGFVREADYRIARKFMASLPVVEVLVPGRVALAVEHYRALRRRGITVAKTIDNLIATYCIDTGTALLHSDADFEPFVRYLGLRTA
jgi:predicted nucleic acid-binding protein